MNPVCHINLAEEMFFKGMLCQNDFLGNYRYPRIRCPPNLNSEWGGFYYSLPKSLGALTVYIDFDATFA